MARSAQTGFHGRARRHIIAMGGLFAERFKSPNRDILVSQNKFLALLLRNAALTEEQLGQTIDSYCCHPQDYAWLLRFRHTTLDKADAVFFARHGRFPTESNDFLPNGDYSQICRTLDSHRDFFDEELGKLGGDGEESSHLREAPPVRAPIRQATAAKGSKPVFTLILFLSVASVLAFPLLIANALLPDLRLAGLAVGIGWALFLACGLIATRPRQFETSIIRPAYGE
jgi:hypothetical protein